MRPISSYLFCQCACPPATTHTVESISEMNSYRCWTTVVSTPMESHKSRERYLNRRIKLCPMWLSIIQCLLMLFGHSDLRTRNSANFQRLHYSRDSSVVLVSERICGTESVTTRPHLAFKKAVNCAPEISGLCYRTTMIASNLQCAGDNWSQLIQACPHPNPTCPQL
ncbi:hypothetical protein T265_05199 [Opisthorchis viverrini]|uniref:Uncharacterized protein n=1 Tax=Opisthorchis viverrini TaxID=6198 RepID=A0A074ZKI5_OPIVI|nr:hypothetical protein T265_05199 [Opisthorchis viverrini]KER27843.1 hypothetical protein T265_05199 [Opisthorchis viverrini]